MATFLDAFFWFLSIACGIIAVCFVMPIIIALVGAIFMGIEHIFTRRD